jgi:hypothetical protein
VPVETDAEDVVGEMAADRDGLEKRVIERVIPRTKVHVEIFGLPSHMGARYSALDAPPTVQPVFVVDASKVGELIVEPAEPDPAPVLVAVNVDDTESLNRP